MADQTVDESTENALLVSDSKRVKDIRISLESQGLYSNAYRIARLKDGSFALPLSHAGIKYFKDFAVKQTPFPQMFDDCSLIETQFLLSKKELAKSHNEHKILYKAVELYLSQYDLSSEDKDELLSDLPTSWEKHGDLVILSSTSFTHKKWTQLKKYPNCQIKDDEPAKLTTRRIVGNGHGGIDLWTLVASALKCRRLAIDDGVKCDRFRSSGTTLLVGGDGWVEHIDNGIKYVFDVTKVMFSSGNVTEKLRVASFNCRGETVLDLYAGIGYFTLPYLVHARAKVVHACEWNADAVEALQRGLEVNGVKERCIIHCGDNRKLKLKNFADRVNLGLIPSSEEGWPVACAALKSSTGGWMHIHGNVTTYPHLVRGGGPAAAGEASQDGEERMRHGAKRNPWEMSGNVDPSSSPAFLVGDGTVRKKTVSKLTSCSLPAKSKRRRWEEWTRYVAEKIHSLLMLVGREDGNEAGGQWSVEVRRVVHVKSYAPHVDHLVADVECRPLSLY